MLKKDERYLDLLLNHCLKNRNFELAQERADTKSTRLGEEIDELGQEGKP